MEIQLVPMKDYVDETAQKPSSTAPVVVAKITVKTEPAWQLDEKVFDSEEALLITTESRVNKTGYKPALKQCAPFAYLEKLSTYSILPHNGDFLDASELPKWASLTENPRVIMHSDSGRRYVVCSLYTGPGSVRGSSKFRDPQSDVVFTKWQVKKWLNEYGDTSPKYLNIPIDSIREVQRLCIVDTKENLRDDKKVFPWD